MGGFFFSIDFESYLKFFHPGMVVHSCNPRTQEVQQEEHKFEAILGYIVRPYLKTAKTFFFHLIPGTTKKCS
jgi:hypothetical protein